MAGSVQTVASADGTEIAYERDATDPGRPALVVVFGAFSDRSTGIPLATALRRRFTVYRYDRRGRGDSGDTPPWAVAREVEDLAAIAAATGEVPFVYGHSAGAALALETAAAGVPMLRLVVYEPPYLGDGGSPTGWAAQLETLVAAGRPEEAVQRFLRGAGPPPGAIAQMRETPAWPGLVAMAHTLAYDVRIAGDGEIPVDRLEQITIPVLAGFGGLSPDWAPRGADAVAAAVPDGRAELLEGQTHAATVASLLPVLARFFSLSRPRA